MPLVSGFEKAATKKGKVQPTQVTASYRIIETEGGMRLFQIDTGGSENRENPGKQSQTIQLNESSAEMLWHLLGQHYGFKG